MPPRTLISQALHSSTLEAPIQICGLVQNVRDFKHHTFIGIRDRSGYLQTVLAKQHQEKPPKVGSFVRVEGALRPEAKAPGGRELQVSVLRVFSEPSEELPVMIEFPHKENLDTVLDHRAVSLRNPWTNAAFRIQSLIAKAFRETAERHGCVEIHSPKLVGGGTEGGAQVFRLEYFERFAYLAQSPQLYKQIGAGAFDGVYEIGPVFRAENSQTSRHLTEFTGLDFEICFIENEQGVIDVVEDFIRHTYHVLESQGAALLSFLDVRLPTLQAIPRISYQDAQALIRKHDSDAVEKNWDKALGAAVQKEFQSSFVFVHGYPKSEKPFYIMPLDSDPRYTRSFDLLVNGLELCSGGQRIHEQAQLIQSMKDYQLDPANYPGYLDTFKFGMPPHGGAGLGLERVTQILLGQHNVRESTLFPRDVRRLTP